MQRVFVVGCPRSGTTVVQAMLGRHPEVFTLPETSFFPRLLGGLSHRWGDAGAKPHRHSIARRLGMARRYGRREFAKLQASLLGGQPRAPLQQDACVERFIEMLDGLTEQAGRSMWIEKTPNHLLYLSEIERYVPEACFIHVIRPGMDVLASLTDANMRYQGNNAFDGSLLHWVQRWNRAADIHRSRIGVRNHHFVFLEDLTRDPAGEWERLCRFLNLRAEVELDQACNQIIADPKLEPWKKTALSGQPRHADSKVERLFGPELRDSLRQRLTSYEELYAASSLAYDRDDSFITPEIGPRIRNTDLDDFERIAARSMVGMA